jgi:Cof subfamily protein (haloacid dehalogenase superfamily)
LKSKYKLLVLDIDGTLVGLNDSITPVTLQALRRAQAAGIQLALCTGRRYSRAFPLAQRLNTELPIVTASGALIKDPRDHRTLFQARFDDQVLREMLRFFDQYGHEPVLYTDSFGQGYDFHLASPHAISAELKEFLIKNHESIRIEPDLIRTPPVDVFAGFVMGPEPAMQALAAEIERRWPGQLYLHVIRSPRYRGYMCEIAPAGVSKWSGVQWIARGLEIPDIAICAVGDDVNDLPMIEGAGLGIAMGNAPDHVKAAAKRVTKRQEEDGLVQIIDWILNES